jgi:hypothetical protein
LSQRRRVDDIVETTVDQPNKRNPTISNDFSGQLLSALGVCVAKGVSSLILNEGEHREELLCDPADAGLAGAGFDGCDHGATSSDR